RLGQSIDIEHRVAIALQRLQRRELAFADALETNTEAEARAVGAVAEPTHFTECLQRAAAGQLELQVDERSDVERGDRRNEYAAVGDGARESSKELDVFGPEDLGLERHPRARGNALGAFLHGASAGDVLFVALGRCCERGLGSLYRFGTRD